MEFLYKTAITHAGKFHADDVFSTALLQLLQPSLKVVRTFEVPEDCPETIVYDIGGGAYDHHQADAPVRENGIPYAAFGLLWQAFGGCFLDKTQAQWFDETFIQPLDEDDNTGCGSPIAGLINLFNPSWDSKESSDTCFGQAVAFAKTILTKKFESIDSVHRAKRMVEQALLQAQDNIVVLPCYLPFKMVLPASTAQFVIYPSQRGGYNAQGIPVSSESNELKIPFPKQWAGLSAQQLPVVSGIETLHFCHNARFLIATQTEQDAIKACRIARRNAQNQ